MFNKKNKNQVQAIDIDLNIQSQQPPSPTFGKSQDKEQKTQNLINTAGKVGKSHVAYFKVMNAHKPVEKQQPITKQQLAMHNKLQSAWLSLNHIVYDVTTYIHYHPGGKILLEGCGKQCDELFHKYHAWVNAKYLLAKYKIGYLV